MPNLCDEKCSPNGLQILSDLTRRIFLVIHHWNSANLVKIYSLHLLSLAVGQAGAFYRLSGQIFYCQGISRILGYIRRATFLLSKTAGTQHIMSGGEFENYSVQELLDLGILIFQWDLFSSCRKARLNVVVEAKKCCVSSPRVPASSHPKSVQPTHNQRQPLKPTYFSTTRLSNQTLVTS